MKKLQQLSEENRALKEELDAYRNNEKLFQALVETAVGEIGEEFFNNIVKKLADWLKADCVIIGLLVKDNLVEGFPAFLDGKTIKGFTYELRNTPCDLTSKKGYCVYTDNVKDFFPKSKDLFTLNIRGYVGIALYNKEGAANGVLCAMSRNELQLPPQSEAILRIVGSRITAEIERIKAQKALEVSEANLKKAILTKDRLFSIISHDLRSPFNSLIGFSKILMSRVDNPDMEKFKKYISIIHDVSGQTYNLLTNLLDWSLTQTNDFKFKPQELNVEEFVSNAVNSQIHAARQKGINLQYSVDKKLSVFADPNMLSTILRNLLSNALKFTPQDGNILVSANSDHENITLSVADSGIGMKPSVVKTLFNHETFYTTKGTDDEKGAGLGLILCREFVKKHRGEIWVKSKPGKGSTFYFTIPVKSLSD